MADKQNMVLQNEATIDTLHATVTTHTSTIATLQSTLTQVNSVKAQLEAQLQNLQVLYHRLRSFKFSKYCDHTLFKRT